METLGKKTSTPMNFAAAAGKAPATPPASSASQGPSGTSKNGSNSAGNQSPASGSQSPAPAPARTGTDKAPAAGSATSDGLDWIIGMNVRVVTQADEVYEGQVYAYDTVMNCLALQCPSVKSATASSASGGYYSPSLGNNSSSRLKYDFRILKINYIKEVTPLPSGTTDTDTKSKSTTASSDKDSKDNSNSSSVYATALPTVGYVHLEKIQQREQQVVREAQVAAARIGVGVSTTGQDIFDALSKTLPCRWAKDSIVVMDEVIISPPYEPENCKANPSSAMILARVKKVLEGERMRLANGRR
ncbi:MAG: anticodon-binding domain-containing protein [Benniella sp.]|nr:MAG: anticodon-binding domain-containing protein [Benniella sp.]